MNNHDARHMIGARAMGVLSALAKTGALDDYPAIKDSALKMDAEWEATLREKADEPATNA